VVRPLKEDPQRNQPNPLDSPAIWNANGQQGAAAPLDAGFRPMGVSMALPIEAGDFLDVSEFHTPEFHSVVRVSPVGAVLLPLVGDVTVKGLNEQQAARAIEKALLDGGMLLHPQVVVLVTAALGQDVSVLGEVTRPGVYPYAAHHRLLDLISAASGLTPTAGRLVSIFHRDDPQTTHPVVLDSNGASTVGGQQAEDKADHNPELEPGDTVLVSRAGLVYVIGDVVRPGGFAVDPVQGLTVVQALTLAWGATANARESRAILIRDQAGGRTLTTLNLKRMIRGQDPDEPVRDKDILFVPDSVAKNMWNKTLESAIQSAVGVTIYAGLVYSQRF
jgi:polysaccharide export outer membrane protein